MMNQHTPEAILALALDVITPRLITMTALFLFAGLAAWAMWQPDYLRLVTLAIFGLCAFLPIVRLESNQTRSTS